MNRLKSNRLLPILGGLILLGAGAVGAKGLFGGDRIQPQPRAHAPTPGELPDGDTPADTIRTLNAKLTAVDEHLATVVIQNDELKTENGRLRDSEASLRDEFSKKLEARLGEAQEAQSTQLTSSVSKLGEQLTSLQTSLAARKSEPRPTADYPVAGGLGSSSFGNETYVWVQPLDAETPGIGTSGPNQQGENGLLSTAFSPQGTAAPIDDDGAAEPQADIEPYFTINNLATLAESTAFTAMIGRVPIGGQVSDPLPFRVLVGRENLAASGLRVPNEIVGMVFEGVAIGDWTLGCVTGELRTATFVFEDGTIRTVGGGQKDKKLGYIADRFGTPCIAGKRVSNAGPYLTAAVGLAAGAGAAEAFAAAETSQVIDDGAVVGAVVGDAAKFALGNAASAGLNEIQRYLADRLNSTFDAVFVPAGAEVSLLIQQEITIDYDLNGRRLNHAQDRRDRPRSLD
ncbi:MAG: TIGR03752 family integrating conjugative element protein [Geminicoccaceae bacterium]